MMDNVTSFNEKLNANCLTSEELEEITGGELIITAALIAKGISFLATGWQIGRYLKQHF
ncbi:hypothetical protein [Streptococcus plurextorum]|uniref:hypothetical protein n=1 Tax=Streptococcus plurextorum TaxID=456876 RepID=UPI0012EBC91E|nr:hypothetical protein [Streptococcus plurextorum]